MDCCPRCGGCLYLDWAVEFAETFSLLACLNCGHRTDPVIEAHLALDRPIPIYCLCGCGDEVRPGKRYRIGHQTRMARLQGRVRKAPIRHTPNQWAWMHAKR